MQEECLCPRARLVLSVTERARLMQRIQPRRIAAMGCRAWGFMSGLRAGLWWWRTARERGAAAMVEGDSQCRPRQCSLGNEPLAGMARVPQGEQSLMRVGGCLKGNSQCPNHQQSHRILYLLRCSNAMLSNRRPPLWFAASGASGHASAPRWAWAYGATHNVWRWSPRGLPQRSPRSFE